MAILAKRLHISFSVILNKYKLHPLRSISSLEQAMKEAIDSKTYHQIPNHLVSSLKSSSNPFAFLSNYDHDLRLKLIPEILYSLLAYRPRYDLKHSYEALLIQTLQFPISLPMSLAVLQHTLRSGVFPAPQTRLLLASAWTDRTRRLDSVASILLEMESVGCVPDSRTCNYVMSSLVAVDQVQEAVEVLKGMALAKCVPDLESYGVCIRGLCRARKTVAALGLLEEMVVEMGLLPRQEVVAKVGAALRADREVGRAVGMIEFLEEEGCVVGFKVYDLVLRGCLECREYILAGKVAAGMIDNGYLPHIQTRLKVVQGLADSGELKLASVVRQRFAQLGS